MSSGRGPRAGSSPRGRRQRHRTLPGRGRSARAYARSRRPWGRHSDAPSLRATRCRGRASPTPSSRRRSSGPPPDRRRGTRRSCRGRRSRWGCPRPLPHLGPLRRAERDLHAMPVRGPQLDGVEAGLREVGDDRRDVPVLRDVVGDRAQLQAARRGGRRLGGGCGRTDGPRWQRAGEGEEVSAVHATENTQTEDGRWHMPMTGLPPVAAPCTSRVR